MRIRTLLPLLTALLVSSQAVLAVVYPLPPQNSRLIGKNIQVTIPTDSKLPLESFAAQHQMGLSNVMEANPGVDPFLPTPGSTLVMPQQLILPDAPREGIIVNSAEMRLYYYPKNSNTVVVLPIGIGQFGKDTPSDWITSIKSKKDGPTWTPTAKMREEYAAEGEILPAVVPAGPDNPMGLYALYVGRLYAIHGTNVNFGIGLRVSHGCVRLRNDDIKYLFDSVPVGTRVQFINEPVKASVEPDGAIYLEVHHPLSSSEEELKSQTPVPVVLSESITNTLMNKTVDKREVSAAIHARSGMPVKVN